MASEYRVSTITYIGSITCRLSIMRFFDEVGIVSEDSEGIIRVEYRTKDGEMKHRGATPLFVRRLRRRRKPVDRFDNQVTCLIRPHQLLHQYLTNCKVFCNGHIQITGARCEADARMCVDWISAAVDNIINRGVGVLVDESPPPKAVYGKICLINSDFRVPFSINNYLLQNLIIRRYQFMSIYEPSIYPAAKVVFYYNRSRPDDEQGMCPCHPKCSGKGCADGSCKKVTIAIFQSGSVIITGANDMVMLDSAYRFAVNILLKHRSEIEFRAPQTSLPIVSELQRALRAPPQPPPKPTPNILRFFKIDNPTT